MALQQAPWTPGRVAQASTLIAKVLWNRAQLSSLEKAECLADLSSVIASHEDFDKILTRLVKTTLRSELHARSAAAIEALADLGVENADDWPSVRF